MSDAAHPIREGSVYDKNQCFGDFIRAYGYLGPADFQFGRLAESAARYVCTDRARARAATFVAYEKAAQTAKAGGGLRALINPDAR